MSNVVRLKTKARGFPAKAFKDIYDRIQLRQASWDDLAEEYGLTKEQATQMYLRWELVLAQHVSSCLKRKDEKCEECGAQAGTRDQCKYFLREEMDTWLYIMSIPL